MASAVDGIGGGGGNNIIGGVGNEDDIGGISSIALVRLTNMAEPCVGQMPGANYSEDDGRGDERGSGRGDGRMTATAPSSVHSVEAARRNAVVGDVPEDTVDGALEHVAAKATGVVATVVGGLYCVGDGINHGIHGRYGVGHLLP
jgi:hypothetical protein